MNDKNEVSKQSPRWVLLYTLIPILALLGLFKFSTAFFLAKKSLPHTSSCDPDSASNLLSDVLGVQETFIHKLEELGILSQNFSDDAGNVKSEGCWMPRRVDAMAVIVVDALRFDFAVDHLPKSVGARLKIEEQRKKLAKNESSGSSIYRSINQTETTFLGQSQLFQFVADPPTVTMQRLKGLTTGGLPTFADISGSFGGANVDEDSWVQQLHDVPMSKRGGNATRKGVRNVKMAFVGDDTWVDLFPNQFDESHPYPSFNTRDLDTVDDGCMLHLPRLLKSFGTRSSSKKESHNLSKGIGDEKINSDGNSYVELLVTHFLGVDHVGHTYGPHNSHMDKKLNQMDDALQTIFGKIDDATDTCQVAFVFGDHGMTENGNHGGGTDEETHAALFAHFSPGCGDLEPSLSISGSEVGSDSEQAFQSINQIDLVPTISLLLGLPIPYANLGGVVPALMPPLFHRQNHTEQLVEAPFAATALALNAAQVWNYLMTYSSTANKLPDGDLSMLKKLLDEATDRYKDAMKETDGFDSFAYREACGMFKYFLAMATAMGKQVWTRFDIFGMTSGIVVLILSLGLQVSYLVISHRGDKKEFKINSIFMAKVQSRAMVIEGLVLVSFLIFHCILLTFSNSYIISEQSIIMFMLAITCFTVTTSRWCLGSSQIPNLSVFIPILIMVCSRFNEMLATGHGLDPMIRKHWAHEAPVFFMSLNIIASMRIMYHLKRTTLFGQTNVILDVASVTCLLMSWIEKRSLEIFRHGYLTSRFSLVLCVIGFLFAVIVKFTSPPYNLSIEGEDKSRMIILHERNVILLKVVLFVVTVTGPSAGLSAVFLILQSWCLFSLTNESGFYRIKAPVLAMIWRLCIRHAFFATGHACSFNQLQYSAAFVAFETFYFIVAGVSLFLNTFGWELIGICFLANVCEACNRRDVMSWYFFYQLVETVTSCISVSILRRHLMVWAIFAPRFVFSALFLVLCSSYNLVHIVQTFRSIAAPKHKHRQ